jgi:hypothetical protein
VLVNSRAPRPGELDGVDYHFRRVENPALMLENPLLRPDSRGCEVPESSE